MPPKVILKQLVALCPEFRAQWEDAGNCFREDDGTFTLHGVFAEFSGFFREQHSTLSAERVAELGFLVSECMAAVDDELLANAAATCFLENIAGEPCGRELSLHLTGEAKRFWQAWENDAD